MGLTWYVKAFLLIIVVCLTMFCLGILLAFYIRSYRQFSRPERLGALEGVILRLFPYYVTR